MTLSCNSMRTPIISPHIPKICHMEPEKNMLTSQKKTYFTIHPLFRGFQKANFINFPLELTSTTPPPKKKKKHFNPKKKVQLMKKKPVGWIIKTSHWVGSTPHLWTPKKPVRKNEGWLFFGPKTYEPGKKPGLTFHYTGWLIGILIVVYYNPHITG